MRRWDVSIMKFLCPVKGIDDLPSDLIPLGSLEYVHAAVTKHFPGTDWNDAAWGIFDSAIGSIEFNLGGDDDPVTHMMLHVCGSDEIVRPIIAICLEERWNALCNITGEFLESTEKPAAGLEAWRAADRDRANGHTDQTANKVQNKAVNRSRRSRGI